MEKFYNKHYKKLMLIPIVLLILAIFLITNFYIKNGDFFKKDVTLSGGVTLSVYTNKKVDIEDLKDFLKKEFPKSDIFIRKLSEFGTEKQVGIIVEASEIKGDELKDVISKKLKIKFTEENHSLEEMGSSLGESFYKQMFIAIILAFIFMGVVVLITFRTIIPSIAVILSAFLDISITIAIINLLGIRLGTAGIAALLLLIGYSIDTDILMTTRIIKRREGGNVFERLKNSAKTGLTMTFTTIVALSIALLVTKSFVLKQMFSIIIIGLLVDILSTYLMNAGILKWYCDKKKWD